MSFKSSFKPRVMSVHKFLWFGLLLLSISGFAQQPLWYSENDLIFQGDTFYIYGDVEFAGTYDTLHHNGHLFIVNEDSTAGRGSWWVNNSPGLYIDAASGTHGRVVFSGTQPQEIKGSQKTYFWNLEFTGTGNTHKRIYGPGVYTYRVNLNDELVFLDTTNFHILNAPSGVPWTPAQRIVRSGPTTSPVRNLTTQGMFVTSSLMYSDSGYVIVHTGSNTEKHFIPIGDTAGGNMFRPIEINIQPNEVLYVRFDNTPPAIAGYDDTRYDTTIISMNPSWYHVIFYKDTLQTANDSIKVFFSSALDGCVEGLAQWRWSENATVDGFPPAWSANPQGSWSQQSLTTFASDTLSFISVVIGNYYYNVSQGAEPIFALATELKANVPGALEVQATVNDVSCGGASDGSISVTVTGGQAPYTYSWNTGANTASISGLSGGTYWVTVTDAKGCSQTDTFVVNEPTPLVIDSITKTDPSACGASDGSATVYASGGTTPYSYLWTPSSQTTQTASNLPAGNYQVIVSDVNGCADTSTVVLNEPNPPAISLDSIVDVRCGGGSDGAVYISTGAGTPPYSYSWSNGATTEDITNVPAGTYIVTVTDNAGCTAKDTFNVNEPTPLVIDSITKTDPSTCGASDGSATVYVSGGSTPYSYSWSPSGQTTQTATGLAAGNHTVTVTDAKGCTVTGTASLSDPNAPQIALDSVVDVSCYGNSDGAIYITVSSGTPPYTYSWNNGATTEDITGLSGGTYSIQVTDNSGCTATANYTVNEPDSITVTLDSIVNVKCNGNSDGAVYITVSGGTSPYSYSWSNGSSTQDITGLSAGSYSVTITDAKGCQKNAGPYDVTEPPALVIDSISVQNPTRCNNPNGSATVYVSGGTPLYSYNWSNGDNTQTANNLTDTTYVITITDKNGCIIRDTITLQGPVISLVVDSIRDVLCNGDNSGGIFISVSGTSAPFSYSWSNGATTEDLNNVGAGTYVLTITDSGGCKRDTSFAISEPLPIDTSLSLTPPTCKDSTAEATLNISGGTPPYSVSWSDGSTGTTVSLPPGSYTATITDNNGCKVDLNVSVPVPQPIATINVQEDTLIIDYGDTVSIDATTTGIVSYTWTPGTGVSDSTSPIVELFPGDTVRYVIMGEDANGCISYDTLWVYVRMGEMELYVPNFFSPNGDGTNDYFEVFGPIAEIIKFRVFDRWGNLVYEYSGTELKWNGECNGQPCNNGVYVYELEMTMKSGETVKMSGHVALVK